MSSRVEQFKKQNNIGASGGSSRVQQFKQQLSIPQVEQAEEKPGFFKRAFSGIGKGIVKDLIKPATVGLIETPLQGLVSAFRGLQATPDVLRGKTNQANKTMSKPIAGIKPLQGMSPTEAATGPGLSAATALIGARGSAKTLAGSLASKQAKNTEQKLLEETIEVVREPLTKTVKERALQEGRIATKGALKQTVVTPSQREREIAEVVKGIVSSKKNANQNIQAIKSKISQVGEVVEKGLEQNNAIFNRNQLRAVLSTVKEDSRVVFGSDKSIENTYDAIVNEFMKSLEKNPKNLSGLWNARKQFDTTIQKRFPNIFNKFGRDDARANAVQDIRRAVNDYISDSLPEGNPFKQALKQMNLMYEAQKNIANKGTSEIGKNVVDRIAQRHPFITKAAKQTGKYAVPAAAAGAGWSLFK